MIVVWVVLVLVALLLGGGLASLVLRDPGYVLIAWDRFSFETSIWVFVVLLALVAGAAWGLVWVLRRTLGVGSGLRGWREGRRARRAREQTVRGLVEYAEGNWARAIRTLTGAAAEVDVPVVNWLSAARAANELGDDEGRDGYLARALEAAPDARVAVGVTRARLQLARGQDEQALATLTELRRQLPKHPVVLDMLARVLDRLEEFDALGELLPHLVRHAKPEAARVDSLRRRVERDRLRRAAAGDEPAAALHKAWKAMDRRLRSDAELVEEQAGLLDAAGDGAGAERLIRTHLRRDWNESLITRYGTLLAADPEEQLLSAEGWLKERPSDWVLLRTLGRIALRARQWERAREYLESSVALRADPVALAELGRLCLALGDADVGAPCLERALGQLAQPLPDLPLPSGREASAA